MALELRTTYQSALPPSACSALAVSVRSPALKPFACLCPSATLPLLPLLSLLSPPPGIPCVKGFFSFNPYDQECTMCPVTAVCPGGARLYPKPGYWHSARQSVQVHKCFNPAACVGAAALNGSAAAAADSQRRRLLGAGDGVEEYKTAQCNVAYQGNLCGG